jgi:sulfur carrier protein
MIRVNGEPMELEKGATVTAVLGQLGVDPEGRGIAVAVDGEVIPRGEWPAREVAADARVEVLTATQGG